MRYRDKAICLRTVDYSETSQVVHLLARDFGAVHLLAKGAKRPKSKTGGAFDLLSEGDVVFSVKEGGEGQLGTLMEFTESHTRRRVRTNADRLNASLFCVEAVAAAVPEADPSPDIFDLLHNVLARFEQEDAPVPAVLAYFQWRLLHRLGLLADLTHCVGCGKGLALGTDTPLGFSSTHGGAVCPDCRHQAGEVIELTPAAREGLTLLRAARTSRDRRDPLPDPQAHAVNRLLYHHLSRQLGKELRMARHAISPGR